MTEYSYRYALLTMDSEVLGTGTIKSPLDYASWDTAVAVIRKHNEDDRITNIDVPCFVMLEREPRRFSARSRVFECTAVREVVIDADICELDEDGEDSPTLEDFIATQTIK